MPKVSTYPAASSLSPTDSLIGVVGGATKRATIATLAAAVAPMEGAFLFHDSFGGTAGGVLDGRTPDGVDAGFTWSVTGPGVGGAHVGEGQWGSTGAGPTYAVIELPQTPFEVGGVFSTTSTFSPTLALVRDYAGHGFEAMLHANLDMDVGGFAPSYWNEAWNGAPATQTNVSLAFLEAGAGFTPEAGVRYRYRVIVDAPWVDFVLEDEATGAVLNTGRAHDPLVADLIGPWLFLEVAEDTTVWHEAWARAKPSADTATWGQRQLGLEGTPIGRTRPAGANFTTAHVGAGHPKGQFSVRFGGEEADAPGVYSATDHARLKLVPEAAGSGFGSELQLHNAGGAGAGVAKVQFDGGYALNLIGNSGSPFLVKPANAADPYFAANIGLGGSAGPKVMTGSGSPEGVSSAPVGSLYLRADGGAGTSVYVKESGTGNTGWVGK